MLDRQKILIGMVAGLVWAGMLLWIGTTYVNVPAFSRQLVAPFYFFAPDLVLLAMIACLALRRMVGNSFPEGKAPVPGTGAEIDAEVLKNTIEHCVLALCLWPAISIMELEDGPGIVLMLSVGFAIARIAYWVGSYSSPLLRAFGFAATLFPTVIALFWTVMWWLLT